MSAWTAGLPLNLPMKSVLAKRQKFTPSPVKLAAGIKLVQPMASGRATPSKKTPGKIDNGCCKTGVSYG